METQKREKKPEGYLPGVHDEQDVQMLKDLEKVNQERMASGQKPLSPAEYEDALEQGLAKGTGEIELSEDDLMALEEEGEEEESN